MRVSHSAEKSPEKIFELAQRGGAVLNLEGRQAIEHAIQDRPRRIVA